MSVHIDGISRKISALPHGHPAKVIGTIAVNGMWFINYVSQIDPELYRRAREFAIDCTKIDGVTVRDANGSISVTPDEPNELDNGEAF